MVLVLRTKRRAAEPSVDVPTRPATVVEPKVALEHEHGLYDNTEDRRPCHHDIYILLGCWITTVYEAAALLAENAIVLQCEGTRGGVLPVTFRVAASWSRYAHLSFPHSHSSACSFQRSLRYLDSILCPIA